jgi:uncharacterized membrane protein YeaQ/YmgE (transglycosylase-associated protein family)
MIVLMWIAFGVIVGLVATKLSHHIGTAAVLDVALSVVGAIAGGLAANSLGVSQPAAFVTFGFVGALVGSVAALFAYRSIFRRA